MGKQFKFIDSLELKKIDLSKIEELHIDYLHTFRSADLKDDDIKKCINLKRLSTDGATKELFTYLSELENFEELHIKNGWFREFSDDISVLKNLKIFTLSNSKYYHVYDFPNFILNFPNLEILSINNCSFSQVPDEIIKLEKLKILDLSNNRIVKLPNSIIELPNLQSLNISNNWLRGYDLLQILKKSNKIPHINTEKATKDDIRHLSFHKENVNKILPYLKDMYDLNYLSMSNMFNFDLKKLLDNISRVSFLRLLDNSISKIPYTINRLKSLQLLDLRWNVNVNPRQLKTTITDINHEYSVLLNKEYLIPELEDDYVNQRIENQKTNFLEKEEVLNEYTIYEFNEKIEEKSLCEIGNKELFSYNIPRIFEEHYYKIKEVIKLKIREVFKLISNFRHSDCVIGDMKNDFNRCCFKYGINNENIFIYTGNPICGGSIEKSIKERFVFMQSLDREGILKLHWDYIEAYGRMDGSGRYDNSLVEILRKGGQILMNFNTINEQYTFFELIVLFKTRKNNHNIA